MKKRGDVRDKNDNEGLTATFLLGLFLDPSHAQITLFVTRTVYTRSSVTFINFDLQTQYHPQGHNNIIHKGTSEGVEEVALQSPKEFCNGR